MIPEEQFHNKRTSLFCNYKHVRVNNIISGGNIKEEKKQEEAEAVEFSIQFNIKPLNRILCSSLLSPLTLSII